MDTEAVAVEVMAVEVPGPAAAESDAALTGQAGQPFLLLGQVTIESTGVCRPYRPVMRVTAEVINEGDALSPSMPNVGLVGASNLDYESWGNGGAVPSLAPGDRVTVTFPVNFLVVAPDRVPGSQKFVIELDRLRWLPPGTVSERKVIVPVELCGSDRPAAIAG